MAVLSIERSTCNAGTWLLGIAALLCARSPVLGAEWYVDSAACPAVGVGTLTDPFCSPQDAVDASGPGDIVAVAPGLYGQTSIRTIQLAGASDTIEAVLFLKSGVAVRGSGAGESILDAGGAGSVVVADRVDADTTLNGFTLRSGGRGSSAGFDLGDGVLILEGAPRLTDVEIEAIEDGLAAVDVFGLAEPVLERVVIHDSGQEGSLVSAVLSSEGASLILRSCVVRNNRGTEAGGIYASAANVILVNSVVARNLGASGGGLRLAQSQNSQILSSTIALNTAGVEGAGVRLESSSAEIDNSIISSNRSLSGQVGGIFADGDSHWSQSYTDVHGNQGADFQSRSDPTGTNGNISQDPMLEDVQNLSLELREGSPAIDSGSPDPEAEDLSGALRPLDGDRDGLARADMGAFEFDRWAVRGVKAEAEPYRLSWDVRSGASGYVVQRGGIADLTTGGFGECLTSAGDLIDARFEDAATPLEGETFFYLVAARIGGSVATLGFDSGGLERIAAPGSGCS